MTPSESTPIQQDSQRRLKRLILAVALLGSLVILWPFAVPLLLGSILAILFFPWLERLEVRGWSTSRAVTVIVSGVLAGFFLPTGVLGLLGIRAMLEWIASIREGMSPMVEWGTLASLDRFPMLQTWVNDLAVRLGIDTSAITETVIDALKTAGMKGANLLGGFAGQLPAMMLGSVILLLTFYFCLLEGRKVGVLVRRYSVYSPAETEKIIESMLGICRSVVLATIASGVVQSLIYGIGCLVSGRSDIALLGIIVFLASFIPVVGAAPVTFGVGIHWLLTEHPVGGITLLVAATLASLADNIVRPAVLRGAANLHPLLAFVAVLGGLQILGFSGVFFGPIIVAATLSLFKISKFS